MNRTAACSRRVRHSNHFTIYAFAKSFEVYFHNYSNIFQQEAPIFQQEAPIFQQEASIFQYECFHIFVPNAPNGTYRSENVSKVSLSISVTLLDISTYLFNEVYQRPY